MGPALDVLEAAILNHQLIHPSHPILTWNISNAIVEMDPAGALRFPKRKHGTVDGAVALAMAVGCAPYMNGQHNQGIRCSFFRGAKAMIKGLIQSLN
jgi:phage terminase large subunit-like protein